MALILDSEFTILAHKQGRSIKIFDTETSGLGKTDQIIQFSGVTLKADTWEIIDTIDFFINIGRPLSPRIIEVTKITDEILETQGISEQEAYQKIKSWFGNDIISGYNVNFDIGKVNYLYSKFGDTFAPIDVIDVYKIVKKHCDKKETENQKLATMTNYFLQEENFQFHRAIDDSIATAKVLQKLYETRLDTSHTVSDIPLSPAPAPKEEYMTVRPKIKSAGILHPTVIQIARWTKSQTLDRLYVTFTIPQYGSAQNMIYYDYTDGIFKECDMETGMISQIDMKSLETQVFDLMLEAGSWTYNMFQGTKSAY